MRFLVYLAVMREIEVKAQLKDKKRYRENLPSLDVSLVNPKRKTTSFFRKKMLVIVRQRVFVRRATIRYFLPSRNAAPTNSLHKSMR